MLLYAVSIGCIHYAGEFLAISSKGLALKTANICCTACTAHLCVLHFAAYLLTISKVVPDVLAAVTAACIRAPAVAVEPAVPSILAAAAAAAFWQSMAVAAAQSVFHPVVSAIAIGLIEMMLPDEGAP